MHLPFVDTDSRPRAPARPLVGDGRGEALFLPPHDALEGEHDEDDLFHEHEVWDFEGESAGDGGATATWMPEADSELVTMEAQPDGDASLDSDLDDEAELAVVEEFEAFTDSLVDHLGLALGEQRESVVRALADGRMADAAVAAMRAGVQDEAQLTDLLLLAKHPHLLYQPEAAGEQEVEDRERLRDVIATAIGMGRRAATALGTALGGGGAGALGAAAGAAAAGAASGAAAGAAVSPAGRRPRRRTAPDPLRLLVCTDEDLAAIGKAVGASIDRGALRAALQAALARAEELARGAEQALRHSRRRGAVSDDAVKAFRSAFRVAPDYVPRWRPKGATWTRGSVVRARLRRVREALLGGSLRTYCWGPARVMIGKWQPHHRSWADKEKRSIYLGPGFWRDTLVDKDLDSAAVTLIGTALIVSFDTIALSGSRSHFGTSGCYTRFLLEANGRPAKARSIEACEGVT